MVEDATSIQENTDSVQNEEQPSNAKGVSTEQKAPEPSQEDKLAELIQTAKNEVAKATEAARREIQSVKDKSQAEVKAALRRAQTAEITVGAVRKQLSELDPDAAKEIEIAELRAREQGRTSLEQQEAAAQIQADFYQKFHDNLAQSITTLGVDPNDTRIDWAGDAPNYLDALRRVLESVSVIQKENTQTMKTGLEKRLEELEKKMKEDNTEANSVDTAASSRVAQGSDQDFLKKFGAGELPMSKANVDRYDKIKSNY